MENEKSENPKIAGFVKYTLLLLVECLTIKRSVTTNTQGCQECFGLGFPGVLLRFQTIDFRYEFNIFQVLKSSIKQNHPK